MATFDTLIDDLASRYGLGANARALIREVLAMISSSPGGLGGFLDTLRTAGLTSEVATWLGHPDAAPMAAGQVEQALGAAPLSGIASRLGLTQGVAATALGYALPKIVGLLTPGGVAPAGVPAAVTAFLSQPESVAPIRVSPESVRAATGRQSPSGVARWLWPALAALAVVAILSYFWSTLNRMPSAPPVAKAPEPAAPVAKAPEPATSAPSAVAQAPAPPPVAPTDAQTTTPPPPAAQAPSPAPSTDVQTTAPPPPALPPPTQAQATPPPAQAPAPASPPATAQAPATPAPAAVATAEPGAPPSAPTPTQLALSNDNGVVRASGSVHDDDAKASIVNALNAVFGADKVKSAISVDPSATGASWLGDLHTALEAFKGANVAAIFEGDKVSVGGAAMADPARDKIIAALRKALGAGVAVDALTDKTAAAIAVANDRATTELASLGSGFRVKDLLFALNNSVVNFASDSAEVPVSMAPFLKTAAAELKQLKAGHVLEVAGYTDNTGDAALNLALSQKRAEAVREALIKYGADPDMLVAKGYGEADPVASNDTADGRLKNRRIEYHVLKAPT